MELLQTSVQAKKAGARFVAFSVLAAGIISCDTVKGSRESGGGPDEAGTVNVPYISPEKTFSPSGKPDAGGGMQDAPPKSAIPGPPPGKSAAGCQEGMARFGSYCIDMYEIHIVSRNGEAHPYFQRPPNGMAGLIARSAGGVFPQGYMNQIDARLACGNAGKRLCSLAEWQGACRGSGNNAYPYGSSFVEGKCNTDRKPHILDRFFPEIPHLKRMGKEFNDPRLLQEPGYLAKTGEFAECAGAEGLHDMAGNLSEWVHETVERDGNMFGTFAGGPFSGPLKGGCAHWTNVHAEKYSDYSIGTRCCADAR
ncbi:MAG: SUMF1/EgtB/PvdO family nonheme iron enzyme [Candidatus Micrarchaeota archaeon]